MGKSRSSETLYKVDHSERYWLLRSHLSLMDKYCDEWKLYAYKDRIREDDSCDQGEFGVLVNYDAQNGMGAPQELVTAISEHTGIDVDLDVVSEKKYYSIVNAVHAHRMYIPGENRS